MTELGRMSLEELQNVKDFEISNEYGSILFIEPVDLTDVDLEDIVTIIRHCAEVYSDTRHADTKPEVG